jgi:hypothetical protein
MKKSKLSLGLIACLLSVGSLAGCDQVRSSKDGALLSYSIEGGKTEYVYAQDILKDYYDDSSKYKAIFDTIYSVIAKNYFTKVRSPEGFKYHDVPVSLGLGQMGSINAEADQKVEDDKNTAEANKTANGTSFKTEFEAILAEKGVKTEPELRKKYVEELQKETFENNYYTYFVEDLKTGAEAIDLGNGNSFKWDGYFNDQLPYHVSHLMVELADTSDTNYSNGTISADNAEKLYNVVKELGEAKDTFKFLAYTYSDDSSSKVKSGNLGIMDYDTTFINEFKLGIYAYEQFYSSTNATAAKASKVSLNDIEDTYKDEVQKLFNLADPDDIPTVDTKVFKELFDNKDVDKDDIGGGLELDTPELFYPRNVAYNKYLNRHAVFFITNESGTLTANDGFVAVAALGGKKVLCAEPENAADPKPIIAVRGSSGGKQEIHFMVVNRDPYQATVNGVSLSDYYTTFQYSNNFYPKDGSGTKLETYASFDGKEYSESKTRADEVASKLKSYNSDKLSKQIFLKYLKEEGIVFTEESKEIETALMKWILTSIEKSEAEKDEAFEKTLTDYADKLTRQNAERKKLIPQACKLLYKFADSTALAKTKITGADKNELILDLFNTGKYGTNPEDLSAATAAADAELDKPIKDWFKVKGGLCNDGKDHI